MRVLVVGGGPAGTTAALQARELGAEVTLVEAKRLGGTSLNEGPGPVRRLARTARLLRDARSWDQFGVYGETPRVDIVAALDNRRRVAEYAHEQRRLGDVVRSRGVEVIEEAGPAVFVDPHTVRVPDGRSFGGDAVIVAVGGHAGRLPIPGAELALTFDGLRDLTGVPASVAVGGGADTGCQLTSVLGDFGAQVTVVEASPRLESHADEDISAALEDSFHHRDMAVLTATLVERLERAPTGITVHHRSDTEEAQLDAEAVFFAVVWPGNADTLGASAVGIEVTWGYVTVGVDPRSSLPHVFAAGDVNGSTMLVPSARHEGRIAAENAVLGTRRRFDHEIVPPAASPIQSMQRRVDRSRCSGALRLRGGRGALRRPGTPGRRRAPGGFLQADRGASPPLRPRRPRGRRVLRRGHPDGRRLHGRQHADRADRRVAARLLTFTEAVGIAAQQIVRQLGIASWAADWSDPALTTTRPWPDGPTTSES